MNESDIRLRLLREAKPESWIALSDDETAVVGKGDTYAAAVADAERNGAQEPVLIRVPKAWIPRVYNACA